MHRSGGKRASDRRSTESGHPKPRRHNGDKIHASFETTPARVRGKQSHLAASRLCPNTFRAYTLTETLDQATQSGQTTVRLRKIHDHDERSALS